MVSSRHFYNCWHAHRGEFESVLREWSSVRIELARETRSPKVFLQILEEVNAPTKWS